MRVCFFVRDGHGVRWRLRPLLRAAIQAAAQTNGLSPLTAGARENLVAGLKHKWEDVHRQYQKLALNIDSTAKVQRKETLEVRAHPLG